MPKDAITGIATTEVKNTKGLSRWHKSPYKFACSEIRPPINISK